MTTRSPFPSSIPSTTTGARPARVSLELARRRYPLQTVPSPCVGVCKMNDVSGWCTGCYRSLEEIARWGRLPDADKSALWVHIEQRQAATLARSSAAPSEAAP